MQISVSKSTNDLKNFESQLVTFGHLQHIVCHKNYSLGLFKDGIRRKENFLTADAIGLDFDSGYSLEQALIDFADFKHIIAPTRSHQKEKNGKVEDRFRVILFLTEPITDAETFEATWFKLQKRWPKCDPQCKDASRFFYPSVSIRSSKASGGLIIPVKPEPKVIKQEIPVNTAVPGQRGKLSNKTLELLLKGIEPGNRNGETYKIAKDFQQNLYEFEDACAQIVSALEKNNTIDRDFPEEEVVAAIKSAYNRDAKHDPRIKPRAFNLLPINQLYQAKSQLEWLVDKLFTVGGVSLVSSDPKAGKSTLVRQLIRDVLQGKDFLGRKCKQGAVHYYGIEEQVEVVNASFRRLGVTSHDPLLVHIGDLLNETPMEDFKEILRETKPVLAVIDTLFDFVDVESENNYKEVKKELRKIRQIARETNTHIMLIHHNSKQQKDDKRRGNRGILGSQAIAGGVDTIVVIEVDGGTRIISTSGREIKQWKNKEIIFNDTTCTYSLGADVDDEEF
jgi:hypothetical protein